MSFQNSINGNGIVKTVNPGNLTNTGLAEIQFIGSAQAIFSNITNDPNYSKTIGLVWNELVYNDSQNHPWNIVDRPAYSKVKAVIDTYLNLLKQNSGLPEYIADSSKYPAGVTTDQMNSLLNLIATNSGAGIDFTTLTMNQLYWDTVQGRAYSPAIAFPRTNSNFGQITTTPSDYANKSIIGNVIDAGGNLVDAAGNIIKTAAQLAQEAANSGISIVKYLPWVIGAVGVTFVAWKWNDIRTSFKGKK